MIPRGRVVHVGAEEMEVWPDHCADGHRCIQCLFIGKTRCAPRFWLPLMQSRAERAKVSQPESKTPVALHEKCFSLDKGLPSGEGNLYEYFAAQPLEPLNDGGFTEEITEMVIAQASHLPRTPEPYRIIDEPCRCSYQYSVAWGMGKAAKKQVYHCPRCKGYWTPSPWGRTPEMIEFARKLRRDCLSLDAIRRKVEEVYHKKTSKQVIHYWVRGERLRQFHPDTAGPGMEFHRR